MLFPGLAVYGDWALLAMRLLVTVIFFWSGFAHARKPGERGKSIGVSPAVALGLGIAGMAGTRILSGPLRGPT